MVQNLKWFWNTAFSLSKEQNGKELYYAHIKSVPTYGVKLGTTRNPDSGTMPPSWRSVWINAKTIWFFGLCPKCASHCSCCRNCRRPARRLCLWICNIRIPFWNNKFRIQNLFVAEPFHIQDRRILAALHPTGSQKKHNAKALASALKIGTVLRSSLYKQLGFAENKERSKNSTLLVREHIKWKKMKY